LRFLGVLGWLGVAVCISLLIAQRTARKEYYDTGHGVLERYHSLKETGRDKVAVIAVSGVMIQGDGFVKRQIDRVREDKQVKAVVLRVDSPGGTVTASDYILHHLKQLKEDRNIPLVVSMGGMAASGGYYISMAVGDEEDAIFAEPTSTTGSIGVIIPHYDISGLLKRHDIVDDSIASDPRKQLLSITRRMTPEDREILQRYVDDSFNRFKDVIKEGRPFFKEDEEALEELATGEIFTAEQARGHGLVDRIGFIEDAIARAIKLARLDEEQVRVITYERPKSLAEELVGIHQAQATRLDPSVLLDMTAPRAYYLVTWLPGVVTSHQE